MVVSGKFARDRDVTVYSRGGVLRREFGSRFRVVARSVGLRQAGLNSDMGGGLL